MRALCIEKPGDLRLKEVPVPRVGPGQVLVKVAACGICMSDLEAIDGTRPMPYIKYPVVLGHEFSGVVESVGSDVQTVKPGARVTVKPGAHCGICKYCRRGETNFCLAYRGAPSEIGFTRDGAFADYVVAGESQIFILPDSVSLELGALTEPGACVWTGVAATQPTPGDVSCVIGPGPIGLLAINFYKAFGCHKIIIVGTRDDRNELALRVGATDAINIRKEDAIKRLKASNASEGPDIIFEAAGTPEAVKLALDAIRLGGRVALAGVAGSRKKLDIESDYFIFRGVRVFGVLGYTSECFTRSLEMLDANQEQLRLIITHEFPLRDFERAFRMVRERRDGISKALLKP